MNTTLLKTFGQKARTLLIDGVTRKLHYWGFDKDGNVTEQPETLPGGYVFREAVFDDETVPHLWQSLKEAIQKEGLHEVAERAAYIWFNRLMALQILGKNGYEQPLLQPVSVEEQTPVIVKRARGGQYDFLNKPEQERLKKILTDYEKETQIFAILLIGFCHSHHLLNRVFGSIDDYTELLLPDDILSSGGFLDLLNNGGYITDEDYKQVELIGWLYQFYISEKKDLVFKKFKNGKKAEAKDIPAATQIFTPNWIVKYMVENTVGKIWLEKHPYSPIKGSLHYLVEAADNNETPEPIIGEVKELKLLDPAVGSGHILVEGFELLYKMYLEEYYPADEAVECILQNNLYGLDIDLRAAQLAQFAVLVKAAQYHSDILKSDIIPHIYAMPAPVHFTKEDVQSFLGDEDVDYIKALQDALHLMLQAQNLGSIMQFNISDEAIFFILQQFRQWKERKDLDLLQQELLNKLKPYLQVLEVLTQKYEAVTTNPPYMGQRNMNNNLKKYVIPKYPLSKNDLSAVFMDLSFLLLVDRGKYGMINQQSWMFLGTYEKLRTKVVLQQTIQSMIHLGPRTFDELSGEIVQNTVFVISKKNPQKSYATYYRLVDYKSNNDKKTAFERRSNKYTNIPQHQFCKIPGKPIGYWASQRTIELYETGSLLGSEADSSNGIQTGDNEKYVRFWWEIDYRNKGKKWLNYNKGGEFRKWYGNNYFVVNWADDGAEIKSEKNSCIRGEEFYFSPGITWSDVTSGNLSARYFGNGFLFDASGPSAFTKGKISDYVILGILNTNYINNLAKILNPTLHFQSGNFRALPFVDSDNYNSIEELVKVNVGIAKEDWDSREVSFEFGINALIEPQELDIRTALLKWTLVNTAKFLSIHSNEEVINSIFNNIYEVGDEVTSTVELLDITILNDEIDSEELKKWERNSKKLPIKSSEVIQQFISYAIGCLMVRYRLDKPGLQIAHPNPMPQELETYIYTSPSTGESHRIEIDEDGIIPLMGSKGNFSDDAYNRLRQFLVAIWGEQTLTQNINFIQECFNQNLEDYLTKKFWSYHVRTYSKKPIYWLFSSKKGAFQVLVYMHRMNRFTAEKIRDKYLLKHIQYLDQEITRMEANLAALSKNEQKKLDALRKDLQECKDYDLLLKDIATKQIEFDLDDGVTRNYELFKGVVAPIK